MELSHGPVDSLGVSGAEIAQQDCPRWLGFEIPT